MPIAKIEAAAMDERQYTEQTRLYFDQLAPKWDTLAHHEETKLKLIVELAAPPPGGRLLDIGCGTGVMIAHLLATDPGQLIAADLSPRMIERAAQKYRDPRLMLIAGDFFELAEGGFDLALLYSVYPHFPDKQKLARQVAAKLVPGGRFMVAHSESRATINSRHQGGGVEMLSQSLQAARQEAEIWREFFRVDMEIDTERLYVISGLRS